MSCFHHIDTSPNLDRSGHANSSADDNGLSGFSDSHRLVTSRSQCSCMSIDQRPGNNHRYDGDVEDPSKKTDFNVKPSACCQGAHALTLRGSQGRWSLQHTHGISRPWLFWTSWPSFNTSVLIGFKNGLIIPGQGLCEQYPGFLWPWRSQGFCMLRLQVAGIMQGLSCPCTFWCFPYWVMQVLQVLQVLQVVILGNWYPSRVPEVLDTFLGLPGVPAARTDRHRKKVESMNHGGCIPVAQWPLGHWPIYIMQAIIMYRYTIQ